MDSPTPDRPRKLELPWLIVAALVISTLLAAYQNSRQLNAETIARFNDIAEAEKRAVGRQLRDIEQLMTSVAAVGAALPGINQTAWDAYLNARLRTSERPADYAGLIALQYVSTGETAKGAAPAPLTRILSTNRPAELNQAWDSIAAIAEARREAAGSRRLVMSKAIGQIPGLPELKAGVALVIAADTGDPASGALRTGGREAGYLIGLLDLNQLMVKYSPNQPGMLSLELFDGNQRAYSPPGMQTVPAEFSLDTSLAFGGRTLQLRVLSTPALEATLHSNNTPRVILLIGILSTILLAGLIWLLTRLRAQAESLATSMTRKLQDQTKFTEDLIEFNPSPIFRKDAEGRFVSVNRAWEHMTGRKRAEVLGKTYHEFLPAAVAELNEAGDQRLFESASGYEMADAFVTSADDREFETIIAKQVLRSSGGSVDGLIGTITDVTPIKRLERELAMQREQLDLVIRSSQQGIWDVDLAGGSAPYLSDRFLEILNYRPGQFPAAFDWQHFLHPDDLAEFRHHIIQHFKGKIPLFDVEARVRCQDDTYIWVRARGIAQRDQTGRATRFVGSISDITDRKRAEQELVEANVRVTEAARAKEAFLATMSHEIRTPLNGVLGMASLLSETNLNDEQRDYIRLIHASGDTLLRLINDVLDFSKIESGRMALESVSVEIVPVVEEALELVADKAREKKLALIFDMSDDVPYYLLGDATRLRQILLNLLSNAIKFTERGEVKLALSCRRTGDGHLELTGAVSDTGIGIPQSRINQLFQPFTQVDTSTTRKYGGTGLGLAICKRLTNLMGGDIRVDSVDGKGATFTFTLLTEPARGPLKPYMQRDVFDFMGKRVLVVDRTPARWPVLSRRLARWGFVPVIVAPGDAAARLRQGQQPGTHFDVLLTDMVLPSPETSEMQAALAEDDARRRRDNQPLITSILQSTVSRSELSQKGVLPALRHDVFLMLPTSWARLFDVLMRAVLHEPNQDVATRPYTPEPIYERDYRESMQATAVRSATAMRESAAGHNQSESSPKVHHGAHALKILVAEDNEINQRVITGMLANKGHQYTVVGDGRSAVNRALAERFDVILMDIHMPELDGLEAMREIREKVGPGNCPPIVAMTANALAGDRENYLGAGMDDYLSKPLRSVDLAALLERMIEKRMPAALPRVEPADVTAKPPAPANRKNDMAKQAAALPILDIEQLEDLRYLPAAAGETNANGDPVGGLIRLFQSKALERMDAMETMLAAGSWVALSETSHSLRGASASMGFPRVAALCKDLELAARALDKSKDEGATKNKDVAVATPAELESLFAQIRTYYTEADLALQAWLAETAAQAPAS